MFIKFNNNVQLTISPNHLKHFPLIQELNETLKMESVSLESVESTLFCDLLSLHTLSHNVSAAQWLSQQMVQQRAGYLRDLYALNCFLGNNCERADATFCNILKHLLTHSVDTDVSYYLGLSEEER